MDAKFLDVEIHNSGTMQSNNVQIAQVRPIILSSV